MEGVERRDGRRRVIGAMWRHAAWMGDADLINDVFYAWKQAVHCERERREGEREDSMREERDIEMQRERELEEERRRANDEDRSRRRGVAICKRCLDDWIFFTSRAKHVMRLVDSAARRLTEGEILCRLLGLWGEEARSAKATRVALNRARARVGRIRLRTCFIAWNWFSSVCRLASSAEGGRSRRNLSVALACWRREIERRRGAEWNDVMAVGRSSIKRVGFAFSAWAQLRQIRERARRCVSLRRARAARLVLRVWPRRVVSEEGREGLRRTVMREARELIERTFVAWMEGAVLGHWCMMYALHRWRDVTACSISVRLEGEVMHARHVLFMDSSETCGRDLVSLSRRGGGDQGYEDERGEECASFDAIEFGGGVAGTVGRDAVDAAVSLIKSLGEEVENGRARERDAKEMLEEEMGRVSVLQEAVGGAQELIDSMQKEISGLHSRIEQVMGLAESARGDAERAREDADQRSRALQVASRALEVRRGELEGVQCESNRRRATLESALSDLEAVNRGLSRVEVRVGETLTAQIRAFSGLLGEAASATQVRIFRVWSLGCRGYRVFGVMVCVESWLIVWAGHILLQGRKCYPSWPPFSLL